MYCYPIDDKFNSQGPWGQISRPSKETNGGMWDGSEEEGGMKVETPPCLLKRTQEACGRSLRRRRVAWRWIHRWTRCQNIKLSLNACNSIVSTVRAVVSSWVRASIVLNSGQCSGQQVLRVYAKRSFFSNQTTADKGDGIKEKERQRVPPSSL